MVIEKLETAMENLAQFMESQGLEARPEAVPNLKGDAARSRFIQLFKAVQRLKTQLDQYTDLTGEHRVEIEELLPQEQLQGFRGVYLETAHRLKERQAQGYGVSPEVAQLDFEFVLFASAVIDYDYIMALITRYAQQVPGKQTMNRDQLIGLILADAKFMDDREDITEYINTLAVGQGLDEGAIRGGYERFKAAKQGRELVAMAQNHGLEAAALEAFVDVVVRRGVFDGDGLSDLFAPLGLGWKARVRAEEALMLEPMPVLRRLAQEREISGLEVYEQ